MAFLSSFITTLVIALVLLALMICGVMIGRKLRANKDAKEAASKEGEKL